MKKTREQCLAVLRDMSQDVRPQQKYVVDDFQPEDALGVPLLYYAVYGEMFPIDSVYDPEELMLLNAGIDQHQVVGRTENGDIIGLYAIFRNPPGRSIMEGGSWLVHSGLFILAVATRPWPCVWPRGFTWPRQPILIWM